MYVCMHACMYVCMCIYIYIYIYIHTYTTNAWALLRTATTTGNDQVISHPVPLTSMKSELSTATNKKRSRLEGVAAVHVILQAFQEIFLGALDFTQTLGDFDGYESWMDWFKGKLVRKPSIFRWRSWGLPAKFPSNQSIDYHSRMDWDSATQQKEVWFMVNGM